MTKYDKLPYPIILVLDTTKRDKCRVGICVKNSQPITVEEPVRAQELQQTRGAGRAGRRDVTDERVQEGQELAQLL